MSTLHILDETGGEALGKVGAIGYARDGEGAIVFGAKGQSPLRDWLELQKNSRQENEGDLIVVVPYSNNVIHEDKLTINELCSIWDVPGRVMRHLLGRLRGHGSTIRWNDSDWDFITLSIPSGESTTSIRVATCSRRRGKPARLRTIVRYNTKSFHQVEHAIHEFTKLGLGPSPTEIAMRPLWFHALIIQLIHQAWIDMTLDWSSDSERLLQDFREIIMKDADLSPAMSEVGRWRNIARRSAYYTRLLRAYMNEVKTRISKLKAKSDRPDALTPLEEFVEGLEFPMTSARETFEYLMQHLDSSLQMYSTIIEINNMNLVRQNIDSMRRIAESSEVQADEMRGYAEESRKDSRDMRRLAFLTMFYLPATAVATIFSIPFLALDDKLEFKAVRKIWIFIVVSVILTALTFIASGLWDKFSARKQRMVAEMFAPKKTDWIAGKPNTMIVEPEAL